MAEPCPRCGAERDPIGRCPSCGFEPEHPGVLGSYREAGGRLVRHPRLLAPFLAPTVVLFLTQGALLRFGEAGQVASGPQAVAGLIAMFLQIAWYLIALGVVTPVAVDPQEPFPWPERSLLEASVGGAGFVTAPWVLIAAVLVFGPTGAWGALGLLASVVLAMAAVVVAGRAVGLPVEAAVSHREGRGLLRAGNRRAREMGGLGLVFLGLLALMALSLVPGIVQGLRLARPSPWLWLVLGTFATWLIGAWIGVAVALGLTGAEAGRRERFTCPRCGEEAVAERGRARCACGLEGPYCEAPAQPR